MWDLTVKVEAAILLALSAPLPSACNPNIIKILNSMLNFSSSAYIILRLNIKAYHNIFVYYKGIQSMRPSKQVFTEKDLQLLKVNYRTLIENYYEQANEEAVREIMLLNELTMQIVESSQQSDSIMLISMLEILKLKAKPHNNLVDSIQKTIIHLKNPLHIYLKNQTLQEALERVNLFQLGCIVITRFFEPELKARSSQYDWKGVVVKISHHCDKDTVASLDVLIHLLPNFHNLARDVSKSGIIKYICSVYLLHSLDDKNNLYKAMKVLKLVAASDRTIIANRQKNLSTVIYTHSRYILILREITQQCFDQQYCYRILNSKKLDLDQVYVWSYNQIFCELSSQKTVEALEYLKHQEDITAEAEWKIYSALTNLLKAKSLRVDQCFELPHYAEKNLNAYLKLMEVLTEQDFNNFRRIDMGAIQRVYDQSKTTDPVTDQLIKKLKLYDPEFKSKKVGHLPLSSTDHFSFENNPNELMESAMRVPKSREAAKFIQDILNIVPTEKEGFANDTLTTIKSRALDSLRRAIVERRNIAFHEIINQLALKSLGAKDFNKILEMLELYLVMNPEHSELFDQKRMIQLFDHIEQHFPDELLDWVAGGQALEYIFGADEWIKHINDVPNRCFWLLNSKAGDQNQKLLTALNKIPLNHPKLPIIVGFLAKSNDDELRKLLLQKTKMVPEIVARINKYAAGKDTRSSTQSTMTVAQEKQLPDNYIMGVIHLSYLIQDWHKSECKKQLEEGVIVPVLEPVYKCFQGSPQEFKFLENSLPHTLDLKRLKDMNVNRLLQKHGKLASYLNTNKYHNKINFSPIQEIEFEEDPKKISETLKFLSENPDVIDAHDLLGLVEILANHSQKYWEMFPFYNSMLLSVLGIISKSTSPDVHAKIVSIVTKIITATHNNQEITEPELDELYQELFLALKKLIDRGVQFDKSSLRREAQKISDEQSRNKIIKLLREKQGKSISLEADRASLKQHASNKYQGRLIPEQQRSSYRATQVSQLQAQVQQQSKNLLSLDQNIENVEIDTQEILLKQAEKNRSADNLGLLEALQMLQKVVRKEEPKSVFPQLVQVFIHAEFNREKRYVLGHLLVEYYERIEQDEVVISLLQLKDKTNLSKQHCYRFLSKFEKAFVISKRYKLEGLEFMKLAVQRLKCRNENKNMCIENGCEVAEYNLMRPSDLNYFENRKCHHLVANLLSHVEDIDGMIQYLSLVGTSAKLNEIKLHYIQQKLYVDLLGLTHKNNWLEDKRIIANLSYALSSLCYTQNQISTEILKNKEPLLQLFAGYTKFSTSKTVVQSACSLITNLACSNPEAKAILLKYQSVDILLTFMKQNINKPELTVYKSIARAMGNASSHKSSALKLIDGNVSSMVTELVEKFDMLIYHDEERNKALKLMVDLMSNLTSFSYKSEQIHNEGVTGFVISLLETAEESEDQILMGCIDIIDGLCRMPVVENFVVMDKKLPYLLIDLLKVKEDQKIITKSIRLLTNMTMNEMCIPYILQANLLSVLANIVLPGYKNAKIDEYVNKILFRIYKIKPETRLVLKSGYFDCLTKNIEISEVIEDYYIDILLHYCNVIPGYLNYRTFFTLVRLLVQKPSLKQIVQKCMQIFKIIYNSEERIDEDICIEGAPKMYETILNEHKQITQDILFVIGLHCIKSKKFREQILKIHHQGKCQLLNIVFRFSQIEQFQEIATPVLFTILNKKYALSEYVIKDSDGHINTEDDACNVLLQGGRCKLYRLDGSVKQATIQMDNQYMVSAFKHPDGEKKEKYQFSIRQLRDWQWSYHYYQDSWKQSVFCKVKPGFFTEKSDPYNCISLLAVRSWCRFTFLNLEFDSFKNKNLYLGAIFIVNVCFRRHV